MPNTSICSHLLMVYSQSLKLVVKQFLVKISFYFLQQLKNRVYYVIIVITLQYGRGEELS